MAHVLANKLRDAVLLSAFEGNLTKEEAGDALVKSILEDIKVEKAELITKKEIKKTKKLPIINAEEYPAMVPDRWELCYIDDIAFVTKLAGFEYTKYVADNLAPNGIPLFKGKNIQNGKLVLEFESYIPESVSDELPRSQVRKKCLLTPYVGTIGNVALFEGNFDAHLGSNVGKIEFFNETGVHIIEEYMLFYLRSPLGYQELTKHKKATAQESISIDAIRRVVVPLPSPEEQKRIVARVEELMAKIDEYEKLEKQLVELKARFPEDMKAALLQAAMEGKLTEQLEDDSSPYNLDMVFEVADDNSLVMPDSWACVKFSQLAKSRMGKTILTRDLKDKGVPVYSATMDGKPLGYLDAVELKLKKNDLVIPARGNSIGYVKLIEDDIATCTQTTICCQEIKNVNPKYLLMACKAFKNQWYKYSGSAIPQITVNQINQHVVPLPQIEEQKRIVEKLDQILPLCDELEEMNS